MLVNICRQMLTVEPFHVICPNLLEVHVWTVPHLLGLVIKNKEK